MNSKIVVGIDFSECSLNALAHAVSLAEKSNLEIVMVWVNKFSEENVLHHNNELVLSGAKLHFSKLVEKYKPILGDRISYVIKEGRVYESINELCQELNPLLVIIGTHGISGFSEKWLGSNAYRVALMLDTPVIIIRNVIDVEKSLTKILLPIDSTVETRQKLPLTAKLAQCFDATVYVLGVHTSTLDDIENKVKSYVNQVATYLEERNVKYEVDEIYARNLVDDIINYADKIDANLLSIMDEQEHTLKNVFEGSYTLQLVTKSKCPVLISHMKSMFSLSIN
jgi:nucleotide-binding universal stress UspA family protein